MFRVLFRLACATACGVTLPCLGQAPDSPDPPPVDPVAEQKLLDRGPPGMRIRRTKHFVIAYGTAPQVVQSLASRLEATYRSVYRFCKINEISANRPAERLEVLFFDSYRDYGEYASKAEFNYRGSSGFYSQRSNVAAFYNIFNAPELSRVNRQLEQLDARIEKLRQNRPPRREALKARTKERARLVRQRDRSVERLNRTTVQHEVAHQVLFNARVHVLGAQNPGWLVEGMACLFEPPPSASGAGAGTTNQMRLADFRACVGGGNPRGNLTAADLTAALASGKLLPLRELVQEAALFTRRGDANLVHHYSQAWALVCHLQRTKRKQFADYLRLIGRRDVGRAVSSEQELADFESVFGPLDERFQRRWAAYILTKLRFKPSELD